MLASHPALGPVDLVKVAHHGSGDQDPALYRRLAPRLALISVGSDNTYGHPRDKTLTMLAHEGAMTVRSDQRGLTLVRILGPPEDGGGDHSGDRRPTVLLWSEKDERD